MPDAREHITTAFSAAPRPELDVGALRARFRKVFGDDLTDAGTSTLARQIIEDLQKADLSPASLAWVNHLAAYLGTYPELRLGPQLSLPLGASARSGFCRLMFTPPSLGLPTAATDLLREIRGLLALHCLSLNESLSPTDCSSLQACVAGDYGWRAFSMNLKKLLERSDDEEVDLPRRQRLLLKTLRSVSLIASPSLTIEKRPAKSPPLASGSHGHDTDDEGEAGQYDLFVPYKLSVGTHADWQLRSASCAGWLVLTNPEFDHVYRQISTDLVGADGKRRLLACGAFVLSATGLTPRNFHFIRLSPEKAKDAHYGVETGHFAWDMLFLNSRLANAPGDPTLSVQGDRWFRVAWPAEVADVLAMQFRLRPESQSLADLLFDDAQTFRSALERYLHSLSLTSRAVSFERLANTFSRFAARLWDDEAYASAASCDFSIGTRANWHYVTFDPGRLTRLLSELYRRLHLSGRLLAPVTTPAGVHDCPTTATVRDLLKPMLDETLGILTDHAPHLCVESICDRSELVAFSVGRLVHFFTASRPHRVRGRVARPFGFALTDPSMRLSRTRLFPKVARGTGAGPPTSE